MLADACLQAAIAPLPACCISSAAACRHAVPQCCPQLSFNCCFVCDVMWCVVLRLRFCLFITFSPSTFHFFLYIAFLHKTTTRITITMPVLLRFCSMLQALVAALRAFGPHLFRLQRLVSTLLADAWSYRWLINLYIILFVVSSFYYLATPASFVT